MIITMIFLVLFVIPILLIILANVSYKLYSEKRFHMTSDELKEFDKTFIGKFYKFFGMKIDEDLLVIIAAFSGLFLAGCIIVIICMHVAVNKNIEINRIEYESLCHRLEIVNSDYEDMSKSDIIKDVSEWNKEVLYRKYWAKNPWTSWFYSQKVVDELKFIDYK